MTICRSTRRFVGLQFGAIWDPASCFLRSPAKQALRSQPIPQMVEPTACHSVQNPVFARGESMTAAIPVLPIRYYDRMPPRAIRVLLLADTHLGIDLPERPRIVRRRRGDDFFANYGRALRPALAGEVDLVVHGGDVFFRSRVSPQLVMRAFEPLKRIADAGVPVVVVPGNHERSAIPYPLLAAHPRIHIIDRPRTVTLILEGIHVALAGFPCERRDVRSSFADLVERTGWGNAPADIRLLCLHQSVEGATVGPVDYVFRGGDPDVISGNAIPPGFAAVLAGHIHRHQVLTSDLSRRALAAPVFYPGSIERTSTAERDEDKGYLIIEIDPDPATGGHVRSWTFHRLPARPMIDVELGPDDWSAGIVEEHIRRHLAALPQDAIVRLRLTDDLPALMRFPLTAKRVRALAPSTMNVEVTESRARGSASPPRTPMRRTSLPDQRSLNWNGPGVAG